VKGKIVDKSLILTITAAIVIVAGSIVFVYLYRYTDLFTLKPTEKRIIQNLDFNDPDWVDTLVELSLPSIKKDFPIYSIFSYTVNEGTITQIYATRASLEEIRSYYQQLLENFNLPESNSVSVLEIYGELKGRSVTINNYYSEVSNLIRIDMEMSGEDAGIIINKLIGAFPLEALADVPEIAAFAFGESIEGYVMYNSNYFATDFYADIPIFSRAYPFDGTMEELKERIKRLGERFIDNAVTGEGIAEIKLGNWLYQVNALESVSGVKAVLIIQAVPQN